MLRCSSIYVLKANILTCLLLGATLLSGCHSEHVSYATSTSMLVDYSTVPCQDIWTLTQRDSDADGYPEYWLRMLECGNSLDSLQAKEKLAESQFTERKVVESKLVESKLVESKLVKSIDDDWSGQFRRGILLTQIKSTENERRQIAQKIAEQCMHNMPKPVCSLVRVWRDNQEYLYLLANERNRNQRLKEHSENQIQELQQQQHILQMKLKSLADIENQLSARKTVIGEKTEQQPAEKPVEAPSNIELPNITEQKPADKGQTPIEQSEDKSKDPQVSQ